MLVVTVTLMPSWVDSKHAKPRSFTLWDYVSYYFMQLSMEMTTNKIKYEKLLNSLKCEKLQDSEKRSKRLKFRGQSEKM